MVDWLGEGQTSYAKVVRDQTDVIKIHHGFCGPAFILIVRECCNWHRTYKWCQVARPKRPDNHQRRLGVEFVFSWSNS